MSRRLPVLLVALVPLLGAWTAPPPADATPEPLKADLLKADTLYDTRHEGKNEDDALALLRKLGKENAGNYDVQWRLARALYFRTEGTTDKGKHQTLAEECWDAGKKAVAADPKRAEGQYWLGICVGAYSQGVGIVTALTRGLEGKFRDPVVAAQKVNDGVDNGGLYAALGRYKYELPWPKRSLDGSVEYLRKGLQKHPANLRCKLYLAESLWDRDEGKDREEAQKMLKEVVAATPGAYDTAEEIRTQKMAKETAARLGVKL
ncbi:MAG: hypothetical protein HY904_23315 [Deltaproteobacteria bacterium]|nr:hypothetical protein [Deltaproteobacteria bacterium]